MKGQGARGKGRPSKNAIILDRMVAAHDPSNAGPNVFRGYGDPIDLMEEVGLEAKLSRISAIVSERLENAMESARKLRDSEEASGGVLKGIRPWSSEDYPENVVFWAEAEFFANDRVVATLTAHLVEHLAIGEELRSIALAARRRAQDELAEMPVAMVEFANRLMACGVSREEVRFMSKQRLNAVIAAIRGMDASTPGLVPDRLPMEASQGPGHDGDGAVFESSEQGVPDGLEHGGAHDSDGVSRGGPQGVETASDGDSDVPAETGSRPVDGEVPVAGSGGDDGMVDTTVPARPKGRWEDLDLEALGYVIEDATASTDADMAALQMRMPEVDRLVQLALPGSPEVFMAESVVENSDRVLLERMLTRVARRLNIRLKEPERRLWGMLLVDMHGTRNGQLLSANGWCDGLVLPGAAGTTKVRRLVAIDRSEEGLRDVYVR